MPFGVGIYSFKNVRLSPIPLKRKRSRLLTFYILTETTRIETNRSCARHGHRVGIMKRITVLFFCIMLVVATKGQTESDATTIAKTNLELYRIELKADSIQISGIINMLVSEKQKVEEAENTLSHLIKGSIDYTKQKESLKTGRIKYEYLINTVNQRYAAVVGFHISDVTSLDELNSLRELIVSRRRVSLLNKYKQLSYDYINSKKR